MSKNRERILDSKGDNPTIEQKKMKDKQIIDSLNKAFDSGFNDPIKVSLFCDGAC